MKKKDLLLADFNQNQIKKIRLRKINGGGWTVVTHCTQHDGIGSDDFISSDGREK